MQVFSNFTTLLNLIALSAVNQEFIQTLTDIVVASSQERQVNTVLYASGENLSTWESTNDWTVESFHIMRALANGLSQPLLHFDNSPPVEPYKNKFNAELLTIVKLDQRSGVDEQLLSTLWQRLWRNTQSRLILLFTDSTGEAYVGNILRICKKNRAMNVIALQPLMTVVERKFWTLRIFPTHKVLKVTIPKHYKSIFAKHLKNMFGHPLCITRTVPLYPVFYNYTTKNISPTLSGYLGRSLVEYAYRLNATIEYSAQLYNVGIMPYSEVSNFIENNNIDIGVLVPIERIEGQESLSGAFSYVDWCLMVPVEQPLPKSTFYYKIIHGPVVILFCLSVVLTSLVWSHTSRRQSQQQQQQQSVIEYFANISVIQGLLGMPFWTIRNMSGIHKFVCTIIWCTGILFGTAYNAFLQSYTVGAPIDAPINTIEDILNRGIKIAINGLDVSVVENLVDYNYIQNLTVFSNFTEYQLLRDSFDTRYAFTVTGMWALYNEQQNYFSRPLFRLSDMCLFKNYQLILSIQQNSLHLERLNDFQTRLHEAGLIKYWEGQSSFVEFLAMDMIHLEDLNKQPGFEPMTLEDLRMVFIVFSAFIGLNIFCFTFELILGKTAISYISKADMLSRLENRLKIHF